MAKTCMFCGGGGPFSKEHVLPEWTAALLDVGRLNVTRDHFAQPTRAWTKTGSFDLIARDVCVSCNNGWMSDLEDTAKPILTPMIVGTGPCLLNEDAQMLLAAWLWKVAILHERAGHKRYFTDAERACLRQGEPPPSDGVLIWIAAYRGTHVATLSGGPSMFRSPGGVSYAGMEVTLALGHFAAQVLAVRSAGPESVLTVARSDFRGGELLIWPERGHEITWPPGAVLEDATLKEWHDRWNARSPEI